MPNFEKGEKGAHKPALQEKVTSAPKPYTEATLLRGMEMAGKNVEDEELREAMKENGIGRPSTRASIIETLFRRNYIQKKGKSLDATQTGIDLIATIENDMLKSPELTGKWEKKLREIERGEYEALKFMGELKDMVRELISVVKSSRVVKKIAYVVDAAEDTGLKCPKCGEAKLVKGKTANGCANFKVCGFKVPFKVSGKKLTEKQLEALIVKGKTPKMKGLVVDGKKVSGRVVMGDDFRVRVEVF